VVLGRTDFANAQCVALDAAIPPRHGERGPRRTPDLIGGKAWWVGSGHAATRVRIGLSIHSA